MECKVKVPCHMWYDNNYKMINISYLLQQYNRCTMFIDSILHYTSLLMVNTQMVSNKAHRRVGTSRK